jgi:hypothetical protein
MSSTLLTLSIGAVVIAAVLLVRRFRRRDPGGYQRRFVNGAPASRHDAAYPYASTLYVGDGGSQGHSHHPHSTDCAHSADAGGGCSDGGGGN